LQNSPKNPERNTMKMTRIAAALVALLLSGGLLAACGSDEKEEYAEQVEDVLNPLGTELQALGDELSSSSDPEQLASGIGDAEETIDQGISDLEAIEPPEGVEQVNEDLISALETFNGELAAVREAAESGDLQDLQKEALALPDAAVEFQQQLTDIQQAAIDAGVPIEPPDGEGS
jgi:hypothetical protein